MARASALRRSRPSAARGVFFSVGAFVLLLVLGMVGGSIWFGAYLKSESFRALLAGEAGRALNSRADLAPLRWSGPSAFAESLQLEGKEGNVLEKLTASQVRANVNWRAVISGAWRVEDITVTELEVDWQRPPEKASESTEPLPPPLPPAFGFLPKRFELGRLTVASSNMRFGDAGIFGTALEVRPDATGWLVSGRGGRFLRTGIPPLGITDFQARVQGKEIFLTGGDLRLGANGRIAVTGELSDVAKLQVSWEGVASEDVFRGALAKHLVGTLSGSAVVTPPGNVEGTVHLKDGRLEGVPLLATIGDFTRNPAFRRMPLQEVTCRFSHGPGAWQITDFTAESKGLLRVEGQARIGDDRTLQGTLQVGVTTQTLQWIPGSRERVFTEARGGYLWTDVVLGGSLDHPTENLSARLLTAMGGAVMEQGSEIIRQTPEKAAEGVKSVLDILRPLVP